MQPEPPPGPLATPGYQCNAEEGTAKVSSPRIFLGIPSYDGRVSTRAAQSIMAECSADPNTKVMRCFLSSSLLCQTFNGLWCGALNHRPVVTHFAMLHADIEPEPFWLDIVMAEMNRVGADIISAVVPFKDFSGLTSTAVESSDPWRPRRLTLAEVLDLPETFRHSDIQSNYRPSEGWDMGPLLINTGCMLVRFTEPWVERACFNIQDTIIRNSTGQFEPRAMPEDWNFSRWAHREGLKVYATRKATVCHVGLARYRNDEVYGMSTDPTHEEAR